MTRIKKGDIVKLNTKDEWNGLFGIIEEVLENGLYAVFCITMAAFGRYHARYESLEKVSE